MENVRIAILDTYGKVLAFLDNTAPEALHFYDDELHTYIKGSAATYSFTADAKHEDAQYLAEGNKLSFIYDRKEYYFTIMQVEKDEYSVSVTAFSCSFELLNDVVDANSYSHPLRSFEEYLHAFDIDRVVEVGRNEVSAVKLPGSFEEETLLARLFSLAELFDAEIELVPVLAKNYSLEKVILNIYREHDDSHQGMGQDRRELTLRYGKNIAGIKKTSDITELFTAIRPEGKDGLSILSVEHTAKDANGEIEFYTAKDSQDIYAVQAAKRFPAFSRGKEGYIWKNAQYDETDASSLFLTALRDLEEGCVPKVTYEIDVSYCVETDRVSIGDTVSVEDTGFQPTLYLSARVTEQVISFTDPSRNKVTFSNIKEEQSQLSPETIKRMQALIDASKTYACSIITDNGIVFKNGEGTTTLTASVMDGGKDLTDTLTITWYKDGEALLVGKSLAVSAADVTGKAVYRYEAVENGVVRGKCEVTVIDVSDGQDGEKSTSYKMQVNALAVRKTFNRTYFPAEITVSGLQQVGEEEPKSYYCYYAIEFENENPESSVGVLLQGTSASHEIPEGTVSIQCSMYHQFNDKLLLDQVTIPVIKDGEDGKDGVGGAESTSYRMQVNAWTVKRSAAGEFTPSNIIVTGFSQTGDGEQSTHYGVYEIEFDGSTVSSRGYSFYRAIPEGTESIVCRMRTYQGALLCEAEIPIAQDGIDGSGVYYLPVMTAGEDTAYITFNDILNAGCELEYKIDDLIMTDYSDTSGHDPVTGKTVYRVTGEDKNAYTVKYLYTIKDGKDAVSPVLTLNADTSLTITDVNGTRTTPVLKGADGANGADGTDGADATAYKMLVNALAIGKTASGAYKQSTITLQGRRQVGSGSFTSYACRFKVETTTSANLSSASWTSRYTSSSNTSNYTYTIPAGVTGIRCSMYAAGGTSTLLDQVIIPVIADGADASLPAVEDLSSGITASGTYVDTTKQVEKLAYRYGKVVQAHLTFYAKTALSSAVTLFSGLPGMNKTMQFVGMNYTTKTPVVFAVRETGEFQMWYAGAIAAGDLIRVGFTYICQ